MKCFSFLLLLFPISSFCQNLEIRLQTEIEKFLLRYKIDDVSNYSPVRFSKVDTLWEMSTADLMKKDTLIECQYQLFISFSKDSLNYSYDDYLNNLNTYRRNIQLVNQKEKVSVGYMMKHDYRLKNLDKEHTLYRGEFYFNSEGKLVETSIIKKSKDFEKGS